MHWTNTVLGSGNTPVTVTKVCVPGELVFSQGNRQTCQVLSIHWAIGVRGQRQMTMGLCRGVKGRVCPRQPEGGKLKDLRKPIA